MKAGKISKLIFILLIAGSVLAAVKMLFFDYTLDEEYQIVMSYRNILGDDWFTQMWEPHQSSSFLCAWLMRIYIFITGSTTGIVLWLRVCTTMIQIGISLYLYKVLSRITEKHYAMLFGLTYFNIVPKLIQIPEFGSMQVWFYTLLILFLMEYYLDYEAKRQKHWYRLILGGAAMSLLVLAYPSCLLLFPFVCLVIGICSKKGRIRDILLFAGTCAVLGIGYVILLLRNIGLQDLLRNIKYVIHSDLTHDFVTDTKIDSMLFNIRRETVILLIVLAITAVIYGILQIKRVHRESTEYLWKGKLVFISLAFVVSCAVQCWYWVVKRSGYEFPQIQLVVLMLGGLAVYRDIPKEKRRTLLLGIGASLLCYAAVIWFSDLQMVYALPHGVLAPLFCALLLVYAWQTTHSTVAARGCCYAILVIWCFTSLFGKGYTLRDGRNYNTVLETRGIIKYGPAIGIMADYMSAYIYNCNYEDWQLYVQPGDKVMIVSNLVMSSNTTPYMFRDVEVSHYSIVNPTAYDERLETYWNLYPEKIPNVIIVDCWYGELKESPDSWIMQYIENEFDYSEYHDGRYVRFYRK